MAHTQGDLLALQLLASVARDAHDILFPLAIKNASGLVAKIAIHLLLIAQNISEQDLSIIFSAQTVSIEALQDLVQIAKWSSPSISGGHRHMEKNPQELRRTLGHLLQTEESKRRVQQSVTIFCKERPDVIRHFESSFANIWGLLEKNISGPQHTLTEPPQRDQYPDQVHGLLLDGVKRLAACIPGRHAMPEPQGTEETSWHITKLCLESGFRSDDQRVLFKIVTATSRLTHWQELAFELPIINIKSDDAQESQQSNEDTFDTFRSCSLGSGDICKHLDNPTFTRIRIELDEDCQLYQLRDPEKIQHIISCHGLPLSELLKLVNFTVEQKIKWTSEDILLFRLDQEFSSPEDILLRVFASFPFGSQYKESPAEYYDQGQRTHRYPRILYLGIILLEIGLGQAIELGNPSDFGDVGHTNRVHVKAGLKLRKLKEEKWDGFASKDCFVEAVENCLESGNFNETISDQISISQYQSSWGENLHLSKRRDALYQKVVAPLYRLATVGFENSDESPVIRIPHRVRSKSKLVHNEAKLQRSWGEIRHTHSSFLSGPPGSSEGFLDHLQVIAGHITHCRRLTKTTRSIRVAILDTGCQKELPFFKDDRRWKRLKGWMDFTMTGSQSATDTFGHGTFMARLLMHVAPIADIYVIRVAENTENLERHKQHIANAILHAGLDPEWKADIISMSFGIPHERRRECKAISDSIEKVTKERDGSVLFFAAAGNSGIKRENFPASHKDVISIYATNSDGGFLESNPSQPEDGPKLLGTYGTDIPPTIMREIQTPFPHIDLSAGSSIATAIAAGVAAMTLSYVAALPSLLEFNQFETECAKLHTKSGMEQMLYVMSVVKVYKHHFINPVGFWGEKGKDMEVLRAVSTAVDRIED
ncbi:S8 family peptidase [Xylaria telfairii]|nr:S8 family peptidase [Xylaria telfairii]